LPRLISSDASQIDFLPRLKAALDIVWGYPIKQGLLERGQLLCRQSCGDSRFGIQGYFILNNHMKDFSVALAIIRL
jgi:hypothetical protein